MMCRRFVQAVLCGLLALPGLVQAFDLAQLRTQLIATQSVRGNFVQEKHLRALSIPLVSKGHYTLVAGKGLLWELTTPLAQSLRITPQGIFRPQADGTWQASQQAGNRESRLFLSLLSGDTHGLAENFELALSGDAADWRLSMTPSSVILRQIFARIDITGSTLVQEITLHETQGDYTILRLHDSQTGITLSDDEARAYTD
ncbi:FIG027190: Putative transmembrane protein [plant metagenome]|uniref:FIG027190: Putative transmembrane protein n=1 Tax=plant metagenome TaxID=1297885 RepID=A0A484QV14_9ZZZZ